MMELTRKGEYAIRGIVFLASRPPEQVCLLSDIAAAVDVPPTFLAKIFQQFSKIGLVKSYRGTGGGFILGRSADKITLLDVYEAIDGPLQEPRCLFANPVCNGGGGLRIQRVGVGLKLAAHRRSVAVEEPSRQGHGP